MMKRFFMLIWVFTALAARAQQPAARDVETADKLYYYDKQYGPALKIYEALLESSSKDTYLLGQAGLCLYHLQQYRKAKEQFRLAALYCPVDDKEKMALYYTNLSACYAHLEDYSRAYEYAVKAYNMDKKSDIKLWNAASHAQNLGRYEDAIRIMDQATIAKDIAFFTLYGRCYLGTGRYKESVDNYEQFFKEDQGKDDLAVIDRRMEQRNLVCAYVYLLDDEQMGTEALQAAITRIQALMAVCGTDSLKEKLLRLFLVNNNLCHRYAYPQALCEQLFAAITGKSTAAERLWYTYYISRDYEQVFDDATTLLRSGTEPGNKVLLKRLQYLSWLQRLVRDYQAHNGKISQPLMDTAISLFEGLFEKGKKYSEAELMADKELYLGVSETFVLFRQHFKTPEEQQAVAPVLLRIMEHLPSEKIRQGMTAILRKGYINN
ncbi:hypothetical protein B0I18_105209 [Taibaiella chishuiensis]|uniref:Tetratricopeptide repeat protein n=2 Tax=Taibaiella chishuiensis TaxID=1434707 RepID=A0A2P8D326_9BACT|nr:hypothetical protein B0I18_105209 [Taibaiella chishuiensis]